MGRRCSHNRTSVGCGPHAVGGRCAARRRARGQGEIPRAQVHQSIPDPDRRRPLQRARALQTPAPASAPAPAPAVDETRAPPPAPAPSSPPPAYSVAPPRKLSKTFWPLRGEEFDETPVKDRGLFPSSGGSGSSSRLSKKAVGPGSGSGSDSKMLPKSPEKDAMDGRYTQGGEEEHEQAQEALLQPRQQHQQTPLPEFQSVRARSGFRGRFVDAFRAATHAWRRPPQGRAFV
ncbi:uncharacterized protein PpBr36_06556 [Pyricularia pennisetigena]|uniref:uncharacterized protein n=1 Tax=Pyricularia pennisetigena TaxID=1578925 RepID=UPI0011525B1E|nr:uncharacterized protein PpBr36_06556 [Pyricularia pennisetigena]TLS23316.1 hypothetical protein PpBr36_06556 [Pyricularia pennisetigena]